MFGRKNKKEGKKELSNLQPPVPGEFVAVSTHDNDYGDVETGIVETANGTQDSNISTNAAATVGKDERKVMFKQAKKFPKKAAHMYMKTMSDINVGKFQVCDRLLISVDRLYIIINMYIIIMNQSIELIMTLFYIQSWTREQLIDLIVSVHHIELRNEDMLNTGPLRELCESVGSQQPSNP
jgi:hypothetical protein